MVSRQETYRLPGLNGDILEVEISDLVYVDQQLNGPYSRDTIETVYKLGTLVIDGNGRYIPFHTEEINKEL